MTKCEHNKLAVLWGDSSAWLSKSKILRLKGEVYHIDEEDGDWNVEEGGEPEEFLCDLICKDCGKTLVEAGSDYVDASFEEEIIERIRALGA